MADETYEEMLSMAEELFHRVLFYQLRIHRPDKLSGKLKGLSMTDLHILRAVACTPGIILKDIRRITGLPHSTLTGIVDRLEGKGLVRRVINRSDLRSYSLELTTAGREVQAEHERVDRLYTEKALSALDEDERRTLLHLFKKVSASLGDTPGEGADDE